MASWLPVNSFTRKVPATDATGTQTPRTPETEPRWASGTWSGRTATRAASSALRNTWAMHQPDEHHRDVGRQRHDEDAERTAEQADDDPRPPHAPAGRGPVAQPAEERVGEHRQQGPDAGHQRQAVGCPLGADQRVDLQRQGDQQRGEEQQAGADERQRVQRDEAPSDPGRRCAVLPGRTRSGIGRVCQPRACMSRIAVGRSAPRSPPRSPRVVIPAHHIRSYLPREMDERPTTPIHREVSTSRRCPTCQHQPLPAGVTAVAQAA